MSRKSVRQKFKESLCHRGLRDTASLTARALHRRLRRIVLFLAYQGFRRQCPMCHLRFRRFIAYPGEPSPLFASEHVIGGGPFEESRCPFCGSTQRERHVFLFLKERTSLFAEPVRVLHLAPEENLRRILQHRQNIRYVGADLMSPLASVHTDITKLSFADNTFDVLICNHVLEHIPDDRQAIAELFRVLIPGGWAVLQVPIGSLRDATDEAPWIESPSERLRRFGQNNHVRLYAARDYIQRLEAGGFEVRLDSLSKRNGEVYAKRFGLSPDEDIFLAKKPALAAATGLSSSTVSARAMVGFTAST